MPFFESSSQSRHLYAFVVCEGGIDSNIKIVYNSIKTQFIVLFTSLYCPFAMLSLFLSTIVSLENRNLPIGKLISFFFWLRHTTLDKRLAVSFIQFLSALLTFRWCRFFTLHQKTLLFSTKYTIAKKCSDALKMHVCNVIGLERKMESTLSFLFSYVGWALIN